MLPAEPEITHREALAALGDSELARLKETTDQPGLLRLAGHVGLLVLTGTAVLLSPNWPLWCLAVLVHGIVLVFLFTLEHEAIHGTAFRTPAINAAVAEFAGFLLLLPPRWFRYFHFAHHRFTQDPDNDPELASPRPQGMRAYLWYLSGIYYWRSQAITIVTNALGRSADAYVPRPGRAKIVREARAYLTGYAALAAASTAFGWTWPLALWVVPALVGQPFLRAFLLAEHAACPLVSDMLANSRTTFANRAVRFLTWNMPYHSAHHALPTVPFHRLGELTERLRPHLQVTAAGYADAHRHIRSQWKD